MPKNLLLIPVGSSGDVHPVVGLAIALKARGHRITVCVNEYFKSLVERNGLEYVEFGTKQEYLDTIADPDVWHPRRGTKKVMGALVEKMLRPSYEYLLNRYQREKFELVSSPLCMGARLLNEIHRVPLVSTHLQPLIFRTAYELPGIPGMNLPAWTPQWFIRWMFRLGDTFVVDPTICPQLNAYRKELGLKPVKHAMDWWNSPDCILGLWPDWFGAPQPDWPPHARLAGFPMYDERTVLSLSPDLKDFLDAGDPPIAFTPGSAMIHGKDFFQAAADACAILKRRGVLLTRFADQIPRKLPAGVKHIDFAPFSLLLPRCSALVHHGGIGTMAQGFQAGIPQLTMPMAHDQPDNTLRLKRLGCGDGLLPKKFKTKAVAQKLEALLTNPEVKKNCAAVKGNFEKEDPLNKACEIIESALKK